jgi:hypothetical protein
MVAETKVYRLSEIPMSSTDLPHLRSVYQAVALTPVAVLATSPHDRTGSFDQRLTDRMTILQGACHLLYSSGVCFSVAHGTVGKDNDVVFENL